MKSTLVAIVGLAAVSLVGTSPAAAVVTLRVTTNDAVPGGDLALTLSMTRGSVDESVASAQLDVIFDTDQILLRGTCAEGGATCQQNAECGEDGHCQLNCTKDVRLTVQDFNATYPEFQNLPADQRKVRLRILAPIQGTLPLPTFDDGTIATCTFAVPAEAALGAISLSANRLEVGNQEGDELDATVVVEPGTIVSQLPTATATVTEPVATITPTLSPTGAVDMTPTPTAPTNTTPTVATSTPTPIQDRTNTPVTVVPTATTPPIAPTNTRPPNTFTPTETVLPVAATSTPSRHKDDGDGCAIAAPSDANGISSLLWLGLPVGLILTLRRRSR